MKISFYKYQGTGNDFILVDNRDQSFSKNNTKLINKLCDRKFGIGADGLILLEKDTATDFKMLYFNADGNQSSMCGNGGRCIVAFAQHLGIIDNATTFMAFDGVHTAFIEGTTIRLKMQDVANIEVFDNHVFLDTGSPHHVTQANNLSHFPVKDRGSKIAHGVPYFEKGANVNFVEKNNATEFLVRTYERGVEDETLSCGTGVTASAIAMYHTGQTESTEVTLKTLGGMLKVYFQKDGQVYREVFLEGPAHQVFKGEYEV